VRLSKCRDYLVGTVSNSQIVLYLSPCPESAITVKTGLLLAALFIAAANKKQFARN
jgi:hypothetical protein